MNRYQLYRLWQHRRNAKGRHGTHSPFVYRFVDEALQAPLTQLPLPAYRNAAGAGLSLAVSAALMQRVVSYFDFRKILVVDLTTGVPQPSLYERDDAPSREGHLRPSLHCLYEFRSAAEPPGKVLSAFDALVRQELQPDDVVAVHDLHLSPAHTAAWDALRQRPEVRMSLDLFHLGLLFFAEEFKVRQHFLLKTYDVRRKS